MTAEKIFIYLGGFSVLSLTGSCISIVWFPPNSMAVKILGTVAYAVLAFCGLAIIVAIGRIID